MQKQSTPVDGNCAELLAWRRHIMNNDGVKILGRKWFGVYFFTLFINICMDGGCSRQTIIDSSVSFRRHSGNRVDFHHLVNMYLIFILFHISIFFFSYRCKGGLASVRSDAMESAWAHFRAESLVRAEWVVTDMADVVILVAAIGFRLPINPSTCAYSIYKLHLKWTMRRRIHRRRDCFEIQTLYLYVNSIRFIFQSISTAPLHIGTLVRSVRPCSHAEPRGVRTLPRYQ